MKLKLFNLVLAFFINHLLVAQPTLWGTDFDSWTNDAGRIFSLPLGVNSSTVQYQFTQVESNKPSYSELVMGANGDYWGMTPNSIFTYNIYTEKYRLVTRLQNGAGSLIPGTGGGSLYRASNGKIYGLTTGCIFEIDPVANTVVNKLSQPILFYGKLFEYDPGKLIGVVNATGGSYPYGYIFEYNYLANTFTVKTLLTGNAGYECYGTGIKAPNGKIFFLFRGGVGGCISEFNPVNGSIIARYAFSSGSGGTGCRPRGSLTLAPNGLLYGLACESGPVLGHNGTVFSFNPNTFAYNMEYAFTNLVDGESPRGSLTLAPNGLLYGFCYEKALGEGSLFAFNPSNSQCSKITNLASNIGIKPSFNNLILASDNKMYGMLTEGGMTGSGHLYQFDPSLGVITPKINFLHGENGKNPSGKLFLAPNNKLYGTTVYGGLYDMGTLFEFDLSNYTFTKLVDFTNMNGSRPYGGLMQASNGKLYGMTTQGGTFNCGVIYEYDYNTGTFTVLKHFTNSNGCSPYGEFIEHNGKLWGLTFGGGTYGLGSLFEFDPATNTITKKIDMDNTNCNKPYGSLTLAPNGKMYGLGSSASSSSCGGIFSYDPVTNAFSTRRSMDPIYTCDPRGTLTLAPNGNLYGAAQYGSDGRIFEYNPNANTLTALYSSGALRDVYTSLYLASNGKLYGIGGYSGTVFEYDYVQNIYTLMSNVGECSYVYTPRLVETNFACVNATQPVVSFDSILVCPGDSALLNISSGNLNNANRWQWYSGGCAVTSVDTGSVIYVTPTSPGWYYVRAEGGCSLPTSCDSVYVGFLTNATPSISASGRTSFCLGDSVTLSAQHFPGNTYQWKKNNILINGAIQQSFVSKLAGSYSVEITNAGCLQSSNAIVVTIPCFPPAPVELRGMYTDSSASPAYLFTVRPGDKTLFVSSQIKIDGLFIELFDMTAKSVLKREVVMGDNIIDIPGIRSGIYYFRIVTDRDMFSKGKLFLK